MSKPTASSNPEFDRLRAESMRREHWQRWGPYLSERQWGTVREDYSPDGSCWEYFPHDHARSRAYRWGEDGLLGICDRRCRLCFALTLWNGKDPILKERLFGLSNAEGNHGEDVKEIYAYLDATPSGSYLRAMYRYPHLAFPYQQLVEENRRRGKGQPEFELTDTGVFDENRFFDVTAEYAKAQPNDILIRITVENRGPDAAQLHLLPTLWFRNTWSWGAGHEAGDDRPRLHRNGPATVHAAHRALGAFTWDLGPGPRSQSPELLFAENVSNARRLWSAPSPSPYPKDAFQERVIRGRTDAVNPSHEGTRAAGWYRLRLPPGGHQVIKMRLASEDLPEDGPSSGEFDALFATRIAQADAFYDSVIPAELSDQERRVCRHAYAGLLWSKQFYHYIVADWLDGDPAHPPPHRNNPRNSDWRHLYAYDVISMPDKWEFPWFASWDLAFHMIPLARIDPFFAKRQLTTLMREWYMHPNGQLPAYEFQFSDVNPPVHAWACWRVYKMTGERGERDLEFLASAFHKLLINFTWWVNRKDPQGRHLFAGGFLGLDNIGVFDRSRPLPSGQMLEQADGTAWMAFFCGTMLSIALELAEDDPSYESMASKFFEHFIAITDAINCVGGAGLWDETEGFYYDRIIADGHVTPLRLRSMVGLIPLLAVEVIDSRQIDRLPGFRDRMRWFLEHRQDLARHIAFMDGSVERGRKYLLAIPSEQRLKRALRYMLDEREFLSPYGVRSLSRIYDQRPFTTELAGQPHTVTYTPGEADCDLFGGNSNWRGPVWFPLNFLLIEALERYDYFYGAKVQVQCPTGSGRFVSLGRAASELNARLSSLFLPDSHGRRPYHGPEFRYPDDPLWRDLPLFHEYFHAETGRGCGASHQTGWTALITRCLEKLARDRMCP